MNRIRKAFLIGAATLALGAGSVSVYAAKPDCGRPGDMAGDHAKFEEQMRERMAKRQTELHDKLGLNANQEAAWKTFTEKMQPGARPERPDHAQLAQLSVPERMEKMMALMKEREAKMGEHLAATKEFYAVLNPAQQKIFNEQFGPGHHHRRGAR